MLKPLAGNSLWYLSNARHAYAHRRARRSPGAAQSAWLRRFLRRNARSAYGTQHGYETIRTVEEYQRRVPLVDYEDLQPWIERVLDGEPGVLTTEPVCILEPTSGSSGPTKFIPYTASLLRGFQRAVGAWMFDLFSNVPKMFGGSQYWLLTPATAGFTTSAGGVPIGFESDLDYFSRWDRRFISLAMERIESRAYGFDDWVARTAHELSLRTDLRFISVWSPSLLLLLLDALPCDPLTAWPRLACVSCWTSGESAALIPKLHARLPHAKVQGKGLLATEGVVTIPLEGEAAPVPAWTSHFLEFLDPSGQVSWGDDLRVGETYTVALTTGSGFARYVLGDRVHVVAPGSLEFVGRDRGVSDLVGEKLAESWVREVVEDAQSRFGLRRRPFLMPSDTELQHYVLVVEYLRRARGSAEEVCSFVEARLREAHHYDLCRSLGQLGPLRPLEVVDPAATYLRFSEQLGQRLGDIKPGTLIRRSPGSGRDPLDARRGVYS